MLNPDLQMIDETDVKSELTPHLDTLLSVLRKEIETYSELAEAVTLEGEILLKRSLESLHESNARKETCILKTRFLEEVRVKTIGRIASILGVDEKGLKLQMLLPYAEGRLGRDLRSCHGELKSIVSRINEENRRNRELLDASLAGVRTTRHFLENLIGGGATYMGSGELNNGGLSGRIYSQRG